MEKTWLTKEEEAEVKKELLEFVKRASSPRANSEELLALPRIATILLNNLTEWKHLSNV